MLGLALRRHCKGKDFVFRKIGERDHIGDTKSAFCKGPGLVEDDCIEASSTREGGAVVGEEAVPGVEVRGRPRARIGARARARATGSRPPFLGESRLAALPCTTTPCAGEHRDDGEGHTRED
jgi:hypothetical protein